MNDASRLIFGDGFTKRIGRLCYKRNPTINEAEAVLEAIVHAEITAVLGTIRRGAGSSNESITIKRPACLTPEMATYCAQPKAEAILFRDATYEMGFYEAFWNLVQTVHPYAVPERETGSEVVLERLD